MRGRGWLRVLGAVGVCVAFLLAVALPVVGQEPVGLEWLEPREGYPGEQLQLTLWGHGFADAREVSLDIRGIEVLEMWVESDEAIQAVVFVPEDASPGARAVKLAASFGPNEVFAAGLAEGFWVLERQAALAPVIDGVEPQRVEVGHEAELNVFGRDFSPEAWVEVGGEGVYVHEVEFISPEHLLAWIEVDEDAAASWREVAVINPGDQAGVRALGLQVVGGAAPAAPTRVPAPQPEPEPDGGLPLLPLAGAGVVLLGLGGAIGRALSWRAHMTWSEEAKLQ